MLNIVRFRIFSRPMLAGVTGLVVGVVCVAPWRISPKESLKSLSKLQRAEKNMQLQIGAIDGEIRELSTNISLARNERHQKNWQGHVELDAWLGRIKHLRTYLSHHPELEIPELKLLGAEDWLTATQEGELLTEANYRQALSRLRMNAKVIAAPFITEALQRAIDANGGEPPHDISELQKFLASNVDVRVLARYAFNLKGEGTQLQVSLVERQIIDPFWDTSSRFYLPNDAIIIEPTRVPLVDSIGAALKQYYKVAAAQPTSIAQLKITNLDAANSALANSIFNAFTTKVDVTN